jgi:hypothetical protein
MEVPPGVLLVESWISGEFHRRCQQDVHLGRSGLFSSDLRRDNLFLDVICAGAVLEGRQRAEYGHIRRYLPYALPLGDDADGIAAHAILNDVLDQIVPKKILREDLELYDALGDLAQQVLQYQHNRRRGPGEFRLRLPGRPTIFSARRELLAHLASVRGSAGAGHLVEVLRQAISKISDED